MRDTRDVRASGLQGDTSLEMIEIIDDDTDLFGDDAFDPTITDVSGRRWVGPVAAAALVAIVGYGVVTSASSSGIPKVAPVSSITPAPRTTLPPAPTTTIAPPVVPYYSADPPREFSVQFADYVDPGHSFRPSGNYQLWATPDASGTDGSWFSIYSLSDGSNSLYSVDAYRVQPGDQPMAISHNTTGQSVVQFSVNRSVSITLTAFGWTDPDLVQLAQSVVANDDQVSLADPSLIDGYQLITSVQPWLAVQGNPAEQIFYASNTNPDRGIGVSVALRPPTNAGGATLDRQIALRFLLDHQTPFDVDGHLGVAGVTTEQGDYALASWIAGDHIVTVSAAISVPELIAVARTVHRVSVEDWNGMQFQAARNNSENNNNVHNDQVTDPLPVSFGTDAAGHDWSIQVSMTAYPDHREVTWYWDSSGFGGAVDDTATIHTLVDNNRTYVLADLPRTVAASAQLTIARDGMDPVTVPFSDTDASFDRTFSAYAFSEPTTYTAQIIGEDGAVLATWPSS
ncbi:MAG: hypothetical protein QOJ66_1872 [Ilumatobacteraceae bacterium]